MRAGRSALFLSAGLIALGAAAAAPSAAAAGTAAVAARPRVELKRVFTGLVEPVLVAHAGDGSGRVFVVEKRGTIRLARAGRLLPTPFLDISPQVLNAGERGLLGLAFPQGFAASGRFYVYHTVADGSNVIARYRVAANPDRADPATREVLLTIPHPTYANHNGGMIAFGLDGYLYAGTGDGGGGGDPDGNAQNLGSLLGKMLRIDVEGQPSGYAIPPDNPFVGVPGARDEIWAYGLRNPWRWSFDRAGGALFIGDVGQGSQEEIDRLPGGAVGGANFGWNVLEGRACFPPGANCAPPPGYVGPIVTYPHPQGCSVTGGVVHRYPAYPQLLGLYLYSDLCGGWIRGARRAAGGWARVDVYNRRGTPSFVSFGEDEDGAVYVVDLGAGAVSRVVSPLFADGFDAPGSDPDWETVRGSWRADARGMFVANPAASNLALVASSALGSVAHGRVEATVRLPAMGLANGTVVFSCQGPGAYRFVRLVPGGVRIGQVGSFGGTTPGTKRSVPAPVARGAAVPVSVDLLPSGVVKVYLGGAATPLASYAFAQGAPGRVGLAANASAARFDDFAAWDRFATLP